MVPSSLPRITVVITPEQHALLSRLGVLQRRSAASYVRQLLDTAQPALERILAPLEAANALVARYDDALAAEADRWLSEEEEALDDQLSLLDHTGFIDGQGPSPAADGEEEEGEGQPPYNNMGVRSDQTGNISSIRTRMVRKHG